MKRAIRMQVAFSCGCSAIAYLDKVTCDAVIMITDRISTLDIELTKNVKKRFRDKAILISDFEVSEKSENEIIRGVYFLQEKKPDTVIVLGDSETISAAEVMVYLYEMSLRQKKKQRRSKQDEEDVSLQTKLIIVPINSENATEISEINTIMIDEEYMKKSFQIVK